MPELPEVENTVRDLKPLLVGRRVQEVQILWPRLVHGKAPEAFAGAGAVISGLGAEIGETCKPSRPMPLVMAAGTADPIVPYAGGKVGYFGRRGEVWGAELDLSTH